MKPILLFLLLTFGSEISYGQTSKKFAQDTIVWNKDIKLIKDNFMAKRSFRGNFASTASTLYIHPDYKTSSMLIHVKAIFFKSKSFMKDEAPYILNHEQIHFDITEIYARKLRKLISEKDFKKVKDVVEVINKMSDKVIDEWQKEQNNYDDDTQHGINSAKQQVWNEKIQNQLVELENYSSTEIDIAN
jgi:hypothetical protein